MSFSISYDIRAIDNFTATMGKITAAAKELDGVMRSAARTAKESAVATKATAVAHKAQASAATAAMRVEKDAAAVQAKAAREAIKAAKEAERAQVRAHKAAEKAAKDAARAHEASLRKMRETGARISQIGGKIESAGMKMTAGLTAPILATGAGSIKMAMDFNTGMANVASLIPGQTERVNEMKTQVLDLSKATGLMTGDLTTGLYQTISALGDAGDPVKKLSIAATAARAGMASAEDGINLVTSATLAYGDTSEAALQKVSDLALLTVRLGKTTFPELSQSIGKVASSGKALGVSQEEIFASYATLAGVVGDTSETGTQLAGILGGFMKPTKDMKEMVDKLGYASASTMMQELGFAESLNVLKRETGGSMDKLGELFESKESLRSLTALLGAQSGTYTKRLQEMKGAAGSTAKALQAIKDSDPDGESWRLMKANLAAVSIQIGQKLLPILTRFLGMLKPMLDRISAMNDAEMKSALKTVALVAALGPLVMILGKVVSAVGFLVTKIGEAGGLRAVMLAVTGPVGQAVFALIALAAIIAICWDDIEGLRNAISSSLRPVMNDLKQAFSTTGGSLGSVTSALKTVAGVVTSVQAPIVGLALKIFLLPLRWMIKLLTIAASVIGIVANGVNFLGKQFGALWKWFSETTIIGQFLVKVFDSIGTAIGKVTGSIGGIWDTISGALGGASSAIAASSKSVGTDTAAMDAKTTNTVNGAVEHTVKTGALQASTSRVKIDINLNAPPGTIGKTTVRDNPYAQVDLGQNVRP